MKGPAAQVRVNRTFTDEFGFESGELGGKPLLDWIHPDDCRQLKSAVDAGEGCAVARHRTRSGEWISFRWEVRTEADSVAILGLPARASDTVTQPSPDDVQPRTTIGETLEAMVHIVEGQNPGMRCSILLVDARQEHVSVGAGPSLPAAYNDAVEGLRIGPTVGSCGTAAFWNVPVVVENIGTDPLWKDLRGAAAIAGVSACWSQPVTAASGTVLGAMALYSVTPRVPTQAQMDGLEIAARMVGLAVERDRLEEQLSQAAKMEAVGILAGGIAHDFNNLLAVILGNAELALAKLPPQLAGTEMLKEIASATVSATDLCSQLLAYAGRGSVSREPLECNSLVRELGGLLQVALSKKATLVYQLDATRQGVMADRSQLRQVIMNLITNASEALGNDTGRIVISTETQRCTERDLQLRYPGLSLVAGEYVCLVVRDTGSGMNSATRAKVFDPFFSTKANGRGLGLSAVQGIVRQHKGAIRVESEEGRGTSFEVLLPSAAPPAAEDAPADEGAPGGRHAHILVVDDEPSVREVLASILEGSGYTVTLASDGMKALDIFRREPDSVDCVLLDLSMPKLDGEEVFHELRKIRSDVRVVLASGFAEQEIVDRFRGAGLAGVIQKPCPIDKLLEKIGDAIGEKAPESMACSTVG
ncbi:MAG: response regulator [Candidatus Binatia bacterium]|nr:response regulator [Candidatus Binatia bacterium]